MKSNTKVFTIDELYKMKADFEARMAASQKEIDDEKQEAIDLGNKLNEASEKGDVAEYRKLYAKKNDLEVDIAALESIQNKARKAGSCGYFDDDVKASWRAYVGDFEKKMGTYQAELSGYVEKLKKRYMEMADEQNAVLAVREKYFFDLLSEKGRKNVGNNIERFCSFTGIPDTEQVILGVGSIMPAFEFDDARKLSMIADVRSHYIQPKKDYSVVGMSAQFYRK